MTKRWACAMWAATLLCWGSACGAGEQSGSDMDADVGDGDGDGTGDGDGDGDGDGTLTGSGEVGEPCAAAADCSEVANPECIDLDGDGTTRCESTCRSNADCSDNSDCVQLNGGVCLIPCQRSVHCPGEAVCVIDTVGVGYCLPPGPQRGMAAINDACAADIDCAAPYASCIDWGDGQDRCASQCLTHADCGASGTLCVVTDPVTLDALCFGQCASAADCPDGWPCEEVTANGDSLCLPPGTTTMPPEEDAGVGN